MQTTVPTWKDYELIDSGNQQRLERLGAFYIVRPEPNAIWTPENPTHEKWQNPDGLFDKGWELKEASMSDGWNISWDTIRVKIRPTSFRHLGIFPEQQGQWSKIQEVVKVSKPGVKVLNLFGYTGMMSLVAASAGAEVTHVDASKSSVSWANENAKLSGISSIRWIVEDVRKFVEREVRRGAKYDVIILDPPVFGRGTRGEIWRLEDEFTPLLKLLKKISSDDVCLLANIYATTTYPKSFQRVIEQVYNKKGATTLQAVSLTQTEGGNELQTGYSILLESK
ncbi:class I SAM-dependent methyltransferase [soil metagenome]